MKNVSITAGVLVLTAAAGSASAGLLGPSQYLSVANSPLNGLGPAVYLETFEDNVLNVPGVTASTGHVITGSAFIDSVDGDDGLIDGFCANGHSWWVANGTTGVTFTFAPIFGGQLPTWAGIVWTDGHNPIRFEAFDSQGQSLGSILGMHADGSYAGDTAEDHFYGISHTTGISAIRVWSTTTGGIELDHLQYGRQVPAPGALCLLALGGLVLKPRRR